MLAAAASMLLHTVDRCRRASLELVKVLATAARCSCIRQRPGARAARADDRKAAAASMLLRTMDKCGAQEYDTASAAASASTCSD